MILPMPRHLGNEATPVTFSIPSSLAVVGQNTLAVEVHQHSGGSSDLSFDFELQRFGSGSFGSDDGVGPHHGRGGERFACGVG